MSADDYTTYTTTSANSIPWTTGGAPSYGYYTIQGHALYQQGWGIGEALSINPIVETIAPISEEEQAARQDPTVWISKAKVVTRIVDLIDEYLINCINFVQRGHDVEGRKISQYHLDKLPFLIAEAENRKLKGYDDGWDA